MGKILQVTCKHLEGELMRVQFAASQLVSDHPFKMGGTETGPSPGEMMMMGLASASAIAGRQYADRHGLATGHVGARTSMSMYSEGFAGALNDGPLSRLTRVGRFWRRLEVEGQMGATDLEGIVAAMSVNTVSSTLERGAQIEERVEFAADGRGREISEEKNPFHLRPEIQARMAEGQTEETVVVDSWRVSAASLDKDTSLVKAVRSLWVVGSDTDLFKGPTPEELLLAALAACTTIYVARNTNLRDIPARSVEVTVRAELPDEPGAPITRFDKLCRVSGDLTDHERGEVEHMAYYCALGETIKHGAPFTDEIDFNDSVVVPAGDSAVNALGRDAPKPSDPAFCDDGSCCVT